MTPIINQNRFFRILQQTPRSHQVSALSHAVAMAGASLSDDFSHLESMCYYSAWHHIEQAERQKDGSDFLNLELLQALLLVIRFEFTETDCALAFITQGRAIRLAKLLCLDMIDTDQMPLSRDTMRRPLKAPDNAEEVEERRRTFWVAFNMDFFTAALTNTLPALENNEVSLSLIFKIFNPICGVGGVKSLPSDL